MDDWKKIVQGLLLVGIIAVGVRVFLIYRDRHEPAPAAKPAATNGYTPTVDDYVYLKKLHPDKPSDLKPLIGTTVWTNAADQLPYFAAVGSRVEYNRQLGVLRGATPLHVVAVLEAVPPKSLATRVPDGTRQALLAFTAAGVNGEAAVPLGYMADGAWTFLSDDALFYEDPHKLYNWPPNIWQAIESHTAVPGMTEQQAGLALGQVTTSDSQTLGDRTVHYDNLGHPVDVTFVKGHATAVTAK